MLKPENLVTEYTIWIECGVISLPEMIVSLA